MNVTEQIAKTLWCPQVAPRPGITDTKCIGSGCMAWRWTREPFLKMNRRRGWRDCVELPGHEDLESVDLDTIVPPPFPDIEGWGKDGVQWFDAEEWVWVQTYIRETDPTATGYCGLAGVPQ